MQVVLYSIEVRFFAPPLPPEVLESLLSEEGGPLFGWLYQLQASL